MQVKCGLISKLHFALHAYSLTAAAPRWASTDKNFRELICQTRITVF